MRGTGKGVNSVKRLTAIKLINWHYFVNETIRLRGSTLLTGDNGSGKSTIFDAIQFALIADQRKVKFNVSAHDETNRDLKGYLRCRTGRDDPAGGEAQGYLRSGDFTSYIALEFQDTTRDDAFLLGFGVDTFAGEPDAPQFFRVLAHMADELFLQGDRPLSITEFKGNLRTRKIGEIFPSAAAYRTSLKAQLGHLDDRFFSLLVKALAFHPITDIRRFVYEYILDEREVKIDAMLENFRQYRQYDVLVQQTQAKVGRLTEIQEKHRAKCDLEATATIQQYVILRATREAVQEELDQHRAAVTEAERKRVQAQDAAEKLQAAIESLAAELQQLRDARARNDAHLALSAIDQKIAALSSQAVNLQQEANLLYSAARQEVTGLTELLRLAEEQDSALGLTAEEPLTALADAIVHLSPLAKGDLPEPQDLSPLTPALQLLTEQVLNQKLQAENEERSLAFERRDLEETLDDLRGRRFRFPNKVEALRAALAQELPGTEARVLCEMLEIPNEVWQNAVEGYLNTQRFDLFVPPAQFDAALAVYERVKIAEKIDSVGLVNSQSLLRSEPSATPGALAEEVVTADPAARAYVDRILGRVMKCESEQELKRHSVAITPTCMTYRNHTARQIEFRVYQTPYIGARAIARQIEQKELRLVEVRERLAQLGEGLAICKHFLGLLQGRQAVHLTERWERVAELPKVRAAIEERERERAQIDVGELNALIRQIETKERVESNLRKQREQALQAEATAKANFQQLSEQVQRAEATWSGHHAALERYAAAYPEATELGSIRYQEALKRTSNTAIQQNFTTNRNGVLTQIGHLQNQLYQLRLRYNTEHLFGGAEGADENHAYEAELKKLVESELLLYQQKIKETREAAEAEFKEHFIFKLQENIRLARQEFDSLNRILKEISFGQDRYQFACTPDRGNRAFYEMIMDEFAMEGTNLFSLDFRARYGETLDELFRLILDVPEEKQAENIRRYTDYRTYLEFDIKIHHEGGETSSFSRVAREKSGGETQTPFYVAIVASFLQLYRPRQNPHSVRLLLFDEAFNRMDPDRAENTLAFIRKLGLQVLAAAPTDKCEIITPHVETTLLVMREGNQAWLEEYHHVLGVSGDE